MIKYLLAAFIAFGAMLGAAAQAAPSAPVFKTELAPGNAIQKVWHCRYWSGGWRWHRWHRRHRGWHHWHHH